ncbi:MAG: hypothetical protein VB815_03010 [Dehalococcoidia bacterium]
MDSGALNRSGYVVTASNENSDVVLIVTDSELSSVQSAEGLIVNDGVKARGEIDVVLETIRCPTVRVPR